MKIRWIVSDENHKSHLIGHTGNQMCKFKVKKYHDAPEDYDPFEHEDQVCKACMRWYTELYHRVKPKITSRHLPTFAEQS